uniref:Uncharacterized protein n=1 Tax=Arundo donax TaxID=35708 RepID=A0A0A9F3A0_ARUDO
MRGRGAGGRRRWRGGGR